MENYQSGRTAIAGKCSLPPAVGSPTAALLTNLFAQLVVIQGMGMYFLCAQIWNSDKQGKQLACQEL